MTRKFIGRIATTSRTSTRNSGIMSEFKVQDFPEDGVPNWENLEQLCRSSLDDFANEENENGKKLKAAMELSLDSLKNLRPLYEKIANFAPEFDFDPKTPGNGYRTFLKLVDRCIERLFLIGQKVNSQRSRGFFQKSDHVKDLVAYSELLQVLYSCLRCLETMYDGRKKGDEPSLYSEQKAAEIYEKAGITLIDQTCFYGRCLGFQYAESMQKPISFVASSLVSYNEAYYNNGTLLNKCKNIVSCLLGPEERAKQIVEILLWREIDFLKSFWSLNEGRLLQLCASITATPIAVNQVISIAPETITATSLNGEEIEIPVPTSHVGKKPIHIRLLSSKRRVGMVGSGKSKGDLGEPSESIIFHIHGGGFVALSSRSHEVYLRKWAVALDAPIISVDYSLAPEAPYPRALEEVLYVYAWVLKHGNTMLGSALKKIVLVGDSAGGNLCAALTLKVLELNLRKPDGVFMLYTPFLLACSSSPSRMLGLCDVLLPHSFSVRCLKAYLQVEDSPVEEDLGMELIKNPVNLLNFEVPQDSLVSPYVAPDEVLAKMPPVKILSSDLDPFLDDCVMFAKKLKAVGNPVTLDVLTELPHGFLNFVGVSKEARDGSKLCVIRMRELLK